MSEQKMQETQHEGQEVQSEALSQEAINDQVLVRTQKLQELEAQGKSPFEITKAEPNVHAQDVQEHFSSYEGKMVTMAGRIMAKRGMGKVSFVDLWDATGKIQIFSKVDVLGEAYPAWQNLDLGDLVEVKGEVFKTHKEEVSVRNMEFRLLAKALRPLPEKFHGLKDTDTRYRKRYLDLIVNPEVKDTFIKRSKIISSIRKTLDEKNFVEVETPLLNTIPGGASALPFITHHNALDLDLYLRISPELYLKRLIVGGFERVYELGRNFRNEGMDGRHNPEFTMMELYQAYTDYHGMMDISEELITNAAREVNDRLEADFMGHHIKLEGPWQRITMLDIVKKETGVDFDKIQTAEEAQQAVKDLGLADLMKPGMKWGDCLNLAFEEKCEHTLIQPTFVYNYPVEISPLTKKHVPDPRLTERFEIFIAGLEFGNAYSELNDPRDQRSRFEDQLRRREAGDEEAGIPDEDYVEALEYGLPPTGGLGIGIDRLVMLLTGNDSIRDVLLFPTMKPLNK